eukprot:366517-Chlamydomonas_euryale.AAC.2
MLTAHHILNPFTVRGPHTFSRPRQPQHPYGSHGMPCGQFYGPLEWAGFRVVPCGFPCSSDSDFDWNGQRPVRLTLKLVPLHDASPCPPCLPIFAA